MLMRPNKAETAVHGCHCPGYMAVRMRKVLPDRGLVFEWVTCFYCFFLLKWMNDTVYDSVYILSRLFTV